MAIPPESVEKGLNIVPDGVSSDVASLTEPLACCVHAQELCRTAENDNVLIIGAGSMGLLHSMLSMARGARSIVVEPMEKRRKLAGQLGADVLEPSSAVADDVLSITSGRGADVAILATPSADVAEVMRAMAPRGRVCVFSGLPQDAAMRPVDLIASGVIDAGRLITKKICLKQLGEGFRHVEEREGLKCVITRT